MYSYRPHDWLAGSRDQNPVQMYFNGLDAMVTGHNPMKALARFQIEQIAQASRFAQAYVKLSSHLTRSRSPQDALVAQANFWQISMAQYHEMASQIMDAWAQMMVPVAGPVGRAVELSNFSEPLRFPGAVNANRVPPAKAARVQEAA